MYKLTVFFTNIINKYFVFEAIVYLLRSEIGNKIKIRSEFDLFRRFNYAQVLSERMTENTPVLFHVSYR